MRLYLTLFFIIITEIINRLRSMIEQCIHIWRTSLVKSYTGYLEEAKTELERHREEKIEERERKAITVGIYTWYMKFDLEMYDM